MESEKRKQYLDDYVDTRKRINISLSSADFKKVSYYSVGSHFLNIFCSYFWHHDGY
jgi:hypothetical protein